MSEQQDNPEQDYLDQIEQHELTKAAGLDAWAEAVAGMLPNMDPDKTILIKEGLKAALGGPPHPKMRTGWALPVDPMNFIANGPKAVDAEFAEPPPQIFEDHTAPDGSVTVFDWFTIAGSATHATRHKDGRVVIFRGMDVWLKLTGEAAAKFWEWSENMRKISPVTIFPARGIRA